MQSGFIDVHCHILPGLDDGSSSMEMTKELLRLELEEGVRQIVFTPHLRDPWMHRVSAEDTENAFCAVKEMAAEEFPELSLYLGSEFMYSGHVLEDHRDWIRPMNGTSYVLVEFMPSDEWTRIRTGVQNLLQAGFDPILAHFERYACLVEEPDRVYELTEMGVCIQSNTGAALHPESRKVKKFLKTMFRDGQVHLMATDCHDPDRRAPHVMDAYKLIAKKFGEDYANDIFCNNALTLLRGEYL
jgi:protein-tyrosine phosphatase